MRDGDESCIIMLCIVLGGSDPPAFCKSSVMGYIGMTSYQVIVLMLETQLIVRALTM